MNQATNPRARGALFTTGKGGGFRLSASDGSGQPTLFNTTNEFSVFSAQRLFGVQGSSVFDILFRDPTNPTQVPRAYNASNSAGAVLLAVLVRRCCCAWIRCDVDVLKLAPPFPLLLILILILNLSLSLTVSLSLSLTVSLSLSLNLNL
jgi:hypothetical protein